MIDAGPDDAAGHAGGQGGENVRELDLEDAVT